MDKQLVKLEEGIRREYWTLNVTLVKADTGETTRKPCNAMVQPGLEISNQAFEFVAFSLIALGSENFSLQLWKY